MKATMRVLVTGTRGKSGTARGLQKVLCRLGVRAWAKITGVEPLSLGPGTTSVLRRSSGAHIGETAWWLRNLPESAEAVILENSAVTPELQPLAARWLSPTLTVWTNARRDHEEIWGWSPDAAVYALARGIPPGGAVLCGPDVSSSATAQRILDEKACTLYPVEPKTSDPADVTKAFIREVCRFHGLEGSTVEDALARLEPAGSDFAVHHLCGPKRLLAAAFSANDAESTRLLWEKLGWDSRETTLWFHNRRDRRARVTALKSFILGHDWENVLLTGPFPIGSGFNFTYCGFSSPDSMCARFGRKTFGFGNIAGLPLELLRQISERKGSFTHDTTTPGRTG